MHIWTATAPDESFKDFCRSERVNVQTEITKGATQTHKKNKISSYWSSTHQIDRTANRHNTQAGPSDYYTNKEKDIKTTAQQQKQ